MVVLWHRGWLADQLHLCEPSMAVGGTDCESPTGVRMSAAVRQEKLCLISFAVVENPWDLVKSEEESWKELMSLPCQENQRQAWRATFCFGTALFPNSSPLVGLVLNEEVGGTACYRGFGDS